jgi:hypothetical protein
MTGTRLAAAAVAGLFVVTGCSSPGAAANPNGWTVLEVAEDACYPTGDIFIGDDGDTLIFDDYKEKGGTDFVCIIRELDVPDEVISQLQSTTTLQGQVTASWDGLDAAWSWHPDDGLDMTIALAD